MRQEMRVSNKQDLRRAVHLLMGANRLHRKVIDNHINEVGMYASQHRVLMYLSRFDKVPSQKEIADNFEISTAAMAVTLKKLEKEGLISKCKNENRYDNRYNEITVTEKGRIEAEKTAQFFDSVDAVMFKDFTNGELDDLCLLLEKIRNNLEQFAENIKE